jgi:hypothetical protein
MGGDMNRGRRGTSPFQQEQQHIQWQESNISILKRSTVFTSLKEQKFVARQGMIAIAMPRVQTQDLERISVHAMRVSTEMESLVQVCLMK